MRRLSAGFFLSMVIITFVAAQTRPASTNAGEPFAAPPLALGTAWYPEHWDEARWEQDLSLMQAAGINMVRVAEFTRSSMEPREGQFGPR